MVYKAIIHGTIFSNARIYLPEITAKQEKKLQIAMNSGLRAALGLRMKGKVSLSTARKKFGLPTLKEILRYISKKVAWSRKQGLEERLSNQGPKPATRAGQAVFTRKTDSKLEKLVIAEFNGMPNSIKEAKIFPKKAAWGHIYGNHKNWSKDAAKSESRTPQSRQKR